jgi:hypothetical protein
VAIGDEVMEQYGRVFEGWAKMVHVCPDEEWRRGDRLHLTPARAAIHAIETVEFYAREHPDSFTWGLRFGMDWEQVGAEGLPSREAVATYAGEVAQWLAGRLADVGDEQMLAPTAFPWTGATRLATLLYCLRHTQHHLAQVAAVLQQRGLAAADWR